MVYRSFPPAAKADDGCCVTDLAAPTLSDLPSPADPAVIVPVGSPGLAPQKLIYFYSSDEWEELLRECATSWCDDYVQVKRLGGPNDEGVPKLLAGRQ